MAMKEKRDIPLPSRPVLLKFGAALAISLGGVLYTFFRIRSNKSHKPKPSQSSPCNGIQAISKRESGELRDDRSLQDATVPKVSPSNSSSDLSPSGRHSRDKDVFRLPEFDELIKECNVDISPKKNEEYLVSVSESLTEYKCTEHNEQEEEITNLRTKIEILQERERNLEIKLLEYYGIKEQENAVMELQNRLKLNNMEAKLYTLKIDSLQSDNKKLEAQVADYAKVVTELEAAKAKIKVLRKKLRSEAEQNRDQILKLHERVMKLQNQEKNDQDVEIQLQKIKELENELEEMKKSNNDMKLEKSELAHKLECVQMLATSALDNEEVQELHKENLHLREQNQDLTKKLEQLQADRYTDIEELVYLRWINACLRYELRNHQPGPGKTMARDLSKTLSPKSEDRAKQLILEYANKEGSGEKTVDIINFDSGRWSSSQNSYDLTDSGEHDDFSLDTLSAKKMSKPKLFSKLMKLLRGKDNHHDEEASPPRKLERTVSMDEIVGRLYYDSQSGIENGTIKTSRTPSGSSSRLSLDLYSRGQKSSTTGESSNGFVRTSVDGIFSTITEDDNDGNIEDAKNELVKYAEALKQSRVKSSVTKRSASFSSF